MKKMPSQMGESHDLHLLDGLPDDDPETDCEKGDHDWRFDSKGWCGDDFVTFYKCIQCNEIDER
jgi:hypothetical protein